ncbi:MAG: hypothetical protein M0Z54_07945 [Thermaerobacter sp.]|nr:hypothetical protein [Thermaerobacter sp.]
MNSRSNTNDDLLLQRIDETCGGISLTISGHEEVLWRASLDGVTARCTVVQDPAVNLVGLSTLTEATVDRGIASVLDYYREQGKMFSWIVGPTSTPGNLGQRLLAHGLTRKDNEAMWGMVQHPLDPEMPTSAGTTIRRVTRAEALPHKAMLAAAYGFGATEDAFDCFLLLLDALGDQAAIYLAWVDDTPDPVAWSFAFYHPDGDTMVLGGSATLPTHRHRGLYRALVAQRLRDAHARGYTTAVVQAVRTTSAPICERLGFDVVCPLELYQWVPPGLTEA